MFQFFFGPGYDKVIYLICIISPILLAIGLSNVIGTQYLIPTKRQREFTISVTCGAIVNFILNLIFINLWKSIGASIATVVAEMTVTGVQFYLVRNEIKLLDVLKIMKKYFISSVVMFLISIGIGKLISDNVLSIIVQVAVSGTVYFGMLLILKDKLVFEGIDLVKSTFTKKSEN